MLVAQAVPQQPQVFRGGIRLVTVNVTVVDGDGRPVRDLSPADFAVTIDGAPRLVQTVDFLEFGSAPVESRPRDAAVPVTAPALAPSRGARTFLLLFDDLSFTPLEGRGLNAAADRMLRQIDAGDLVGVATTSGLGPVIEPTRDRRTLASAIASLAGRNTETADPFFIGVHEAAAHYAGRDREFAAVIARECGTANSVAGSGLCPEQVQAAAYRLAVQARLRFQAQLAALSGAMTAMTRAPAPRVILLLSNGTSVDIAPDLEAAMDRLSQSAAAAGVQLYALTDIGDDIDMRDRSGLRTAARRSERVALTQGLQAVTAAAGGTAFRVIGTADRFFDRISAETSAVYQLGVELPATLQSTGPLRAEVTVRREGVTVRTTKRAIEKAPVLPRGEAMRRRFAQGGASFGVPLSVAARIRKHTAPGVQVVVEARVPGDVALPISLQFGLVDARGMMAFAAQKDLTVRGQGEHQIVVPLPVAAGAYRLRVVAADGSGNIGSAELPIVAELTRAGEFELSDLLVTVVDRSGGERFLAGEEIPASAARMTAVLELHPRAAMPADVTVRFALLSADESSTLQEDSVSASIAGDRWTATATLSAAELRSGQYVLRASVLQAGTLLGVQSRVLRR